MWTLRVAVLAADTARERHLVALVAASGHRVAPDAPEVLLADAEALPVRGALALLPAVVLGTEAEGADPGAAASLPHRPSARQLDAALRAAAAGLVVRQRSAPAGERGFRAAEEAAPLLTPREVEVLAGIGLGLSNKAVARRLGISAHTVKFHLEAAFRKLGATSRAEAVAKGLRQGLIEI